MSPQFRYNVAGHTMLLIRLLNIQIDILEILAVLCTEHAGSQVHGGKGLDRQLKNWQWERTLWSIKRLWTADKHSDFLKSLFSS